MSHNSDIAELESILDEEVRTNNDGVHFVDLSLESGSASIYTPTMNEIKDAGFEVEAVRAGFEKNLRIWFNEVES